MVRVDPPDARLILASGSPRRRAFMEAAGVAVALRPVDLDEAPHPGEDPLTCCRRLARAKAQAGHLMAPTTGLEWSLGSDTVVTLDGRNLGKPADAGEALAMLRDLCGRTHQVITAWALAHRSGRVEVGESVTSVTFRPAGDAELAAYVATGDPLDKAGAYGIQSGAGRFVVDVQGSFDGVVGLPLAEVCAELERLGIVTFPHGLAPRLARVRSQIAGAAVAAGRDPASVTLIGVTKGQSVAALEEAVRLGLRDLGENYIQEWQGKAAALPSGPTWHFIGHLQRNKARFAAEHATRIHSVDSARLARTLGEAARAAGRILPILVEVNLADEASKSGISPAKLPDFMEEIRQIEGVGLEGLMAIPPALPPAETRPWFARLRALRDALAAPTHPLPHLSMGMSGDFREAIAEGATLVRVGTAIFGARS
jgi:MAF protein